MARGAERQKVIYDSALFPICIPIRIPISEIYPHKLVSKSYSLDRTEVIVLSERRLERGVAQPIPDKVDVKPIVIALVKKSIGETMAQDVRMDVLRIPAAEVPVLVFVGADIGFDRSPFDEIPN